ncbi:hypothetical protein [Actinomadura sp. HBU206391]|uniref:hypothetical protein n=1 Tax=Actinomadura sp. HBU206391 TaxID=2731692 RepID=UPI00165053FF|nr:hypothetical protein [Actinomadura sp. HBU206391]MBC6462092.1 hypothetical protein [Actinomadura sp. HBU206391]
MDGHTAAFLRRARRLTLAGAAALSAAVGVHRYGPGADGTWRCLNCGTAEPCRTLRRTAEALTAYLGAQPYGIDRAEAWRRAETWLTRGGRPRVAVAVEEFAEGYIARPIPYGPEEHEHERVVVVDRRTGGLTLWPVLPENVLAEQYRRYKLGLHLGLDPGTHPA